MMTFAAAIHVSAEDYVGNLDFSLSSASGEPNDFVEINLDLNENPGVFGFWLMVYYDSDVLSLESVAFNEGITAFGEFSDTENNMQADQYKGPVSLSTLDRFNESGITVEDKNFKVIYFENFSITEDTVYTGNIATLVFQIKDGAAEGDYPVGIMPAPDGNQINCAGEDLSVLVTNGIVHVEPAPETEEPDTEEPVETDGPDTEEPVETEEPAPDTEDETEPGEVIAPADTDPSDGGIKKDTNPVSPTTGYGTQQNDSTLVMSIAVLVVISAIALACTVFMLKAKRNNK